MKFPLSKDAFKEHSFLRICVVHFTIFSVLLLALYLGFIFIYTYLLNNSFSTMEDILKYKTEMKTDHYADIPIGNFKDCSFIVFDEKNKVLYASEKELKNEIKGSDTYMIENYNSTANYSITKYKSGPYKNGYYIQRCETGKDETIYSTGHLIVDAHLKRVSGTLFTVNQLTKSELNLLSGKLIDANQNEFSVTKYSYNNHKGKARTFIYVYPTFTKVAYDEAERDIVKYIPIPIGLVILLILLQTAIFDRSIKRSLQPLNEAMLSYAKGQPAFVDKKSMPAEFEDVVQNFENLMEALAKSEAEKDKANRDRQRMIVDVSHDLKTPLTVVQGYAKALADHKVPEDRVESYLQTINQKAIAASELMDSLFAYARMEHPEYKLNCVEVDFHEWLAAYLSSREEEIRLKGFFLDTEIPDDIELASIDLNLFPRVFDNLINNTLKYNAVGTHILVKVTEHNDKMTIYVADDGVGISNEIGDRIFEAFVTTNEARTSGKGTGLGMSIVKRIVELHGGTISLGHLDGYATTFVIAMKRGFTKKANA